MRIAYFDLETTDLKGDFGRILCGSVLSLGDGERTMTTLRQDDFVREKLAISMNDDEALTIALRDLLEEHHITVGWYSKGFDVPMLNTRLAAHGQRLLQSGLHLDPIWYFRGWRGLNPRSSKLAVVAEFFQLENRKQAVDADIWVKAYGGDRKAMDIVQDRCESDVELLAEVTAHALDLGLVKNIQRYP